MDQFSSWRDSFVVCSSFHRKPEGVDRKTPDGWTGDETKIEEKHGTWDRTNAIRAENDWPCSLDWYRVKIWGTFLFLPLRTFSISIHHYSLLETFSLFLSRTFQLSNLRISAWNSKIFAYIFLRINVQLCCLRLPGSGHLNHGLRPLSICARMRHSPEIWQLNCSPPRPFKWGNNAFELGAG